MKPQFDPKDADETLEHAAMVAKDTEQNIPEAPAVANIKVWISGYGVMLTVRSEKMSDVIAKTEYLIERAIAKGWKNTWDTPTPSNGHTVKDVNAQLKTPPNCSIHGTPMEWKEGVSKKTGKPYSFFACNQKLADGSYCNGKPMEK